MNIDQIGGKVADAMAVRTRSAELLDVWLDGFIKECEDRGVDPERFLSILVKEHENEQTIQADADRK